MESSRLSSDKQQLLLGSRASASHYSSSSYTFASPPLRLHLFLSCSCTATQSWCMWFSSHQQLVEVMCFVWVQTGEKKVVILQTGHVNYVEFKMIYLLWLFTFNNQLVLLVLLFSYGSIGKQWADSLLPPTAMVCPCKTHFYSDLNRETLDTCGFKTQFYHLSCKKYNFVGTIEMY